MFSLTLIETEDAKTEEVSGGTVFSGGATFEHFRHQFRELPAQKIQQIIAIITKPDKQPRSDKGRKRKQDSTPMLPGAGT